MKSNLSTHYMLTTNTGVSAGANNSAGQASLVNKAELSKRLSVCCRQIDAWVSKRVISHVKIGPHCIRYDVADVIFDLKQRFQVCPRDRR